MTEQVNAATRKMVDFILATSLSTIGPEDAQIEDMYEALDDQQRCEVIFALSMLAWQQAIDLEAGDETAAALRIAEYRRAK